MTPEHTYTRQEMPEPDGGVVYVCNDCGGVGCTSPEEVLHFDNCVVGAAKHWEEYYSKEGNND